MKITTSKQFELDARDLLKGAVTAGVTAGIAVIGNILELWTESNSFSIKDISYMLILKAVFAAFAGYLIKNFLTPSKVVIKASKLETIAEVETKIEEIN